MIQVINKYGAVKAPAPASSSAVWGAITGTVTAQTDLTGYISSNYYPLLSNPAGYITSSSLTGLVPYTGATANVNLGTFSLTTPTINGVSGLLSFGSTDRVNIGNYATPNTLRIFTVGQDTAWATMGSCSDYTPFFGLAFNQTAPTTANSILIGSSNSSSLQATGVVTIRANGVYPISCNSGNLVFLTNVLTSGAITSFVFTKPNNTGQTASTPIIGFSYVGGTRQWATGAITTQSENVWGATTYSFVGASTITNAYGNVFNAPIAGTNCTITNNFAAQFNGQVEMTNGIRLTGVAPTTPVNGDIWYNGTDLKLKSNGLTKDLTTSTTLDTLVFSGSYMPAKLGYVAPSHTAGINGVLASKKISGRKTCTITSLSVWCLTGVAGGNVRLAVYSDLNGLPNTLLADTGNIACISSGLKEGTITPLTLVSGTTYHVVHQVSSGTISLKYNISEETNYYDPTNFVYVFTVSAAFAFGAFPTTFPAVTYQSGAGYNEVIYLKAQ